MPDTILSSFLGQAPKNSASLTVRDVLRLPAFEQARVVAGGAGLERPVLWSHVVEIPDPAPWVPPGYFLLTTGLSWPRDAAGQRALIDALAAKGVAGVVLAVPGYIGGFDAAAREIADRAFLPLVELPYDVPFARVSEELHRAIAAEPYRLVERSEHIHRALMRAASREATLEDLARTLSPLIGRSVTFEDPTGRLLAHCSIDARTDAMRQATLEGAQTPATMLQLLESTGLDKRIRQSDKPIRVPAMPDVGLSARVVCPIRLGSEFVGAVWIIEGQQGLSELDHRAAEYAALVAAIHIAHQRELAALEAALGHASLLSLLELEHDPAPEAQERVALLGFDPECVYRAAVVALPAAVPLDREDARKRDRVAGRVREILLAAGERPLVTVTLDRVVFLASCELSIDDVAAVLDSDASIVVGRAYRGVAGARRSYSEALSLLRYRQRKRICEYDDVLLPRVLGGDSEARQAFLDNLLQPLLAQRGGHALVTAVLELARSGFAMKETARRLGIHPNTLRYRLGRASDALQARFDDPEVRFTLQLAARLLDFAEA